MRFPREHRPIRVLTLAACTIGLVAPLSAQGAAKSALQDPTSYALTSMSPIAPGVDLAGFQSPATGGTATSDVVSVNLTVPGVSTGLLASHVTDVKPVSTYAQESGAVVAVNGDYYAIGASNAPQGPEIRGGTLLKAIAGHAPVEGVGTDGIARSGNVWLDGSARWGNGADVNLERYNSDLNGGSMPATSLSLFDSNWGKSKVGFIGAPAKVSYTLVDANGNVLSSSRTFTPQTVPSGGLLLVGTGSWTSIGALPKGTPVSHQIAAATDAPAPF